MGEVERVQPKASSGVKPRVKQGGYSFIELLVAVSLVSIISLVALPSFRALHSEISLIESELHLHALGAGWESGVLDTAIRPDSELFGRQSWRQLE